MKKLFAILAVGFVLIGSCGIFLPHSHHGPFEQDCPACFWNAGYVAAGLLLLSLFLVLTCLCCTRDMSVHSILSRTISSTAPRGPPSL